jgi:7SK snRNA methylphosphate capping enzyme
VYGASRVVGVDIDATLVSQAWKRRRHVWSLQKPIGGTADPVKLGTTDSNTRGNEGVALTSHEERDIVRPDYFPAALLHMFGPVPLPESLNGTRNTFPLNVTFRAADWVNDGVPEDADGWDVIIGCVHGG